MKKSRRSRWAKRAIALYVVIVVLVVLGMAGVRVRSAEAERAAEVTHPAIPRLWERTDNPVAAGMVSRSWFWGPAAITAMSENYTQTRGGYRQVTYFDKSRMEITNLGADPQSPWFVTNGLLTRELVSGQLQLGDTSFEAHNSALIPVAGDPVQTGGPTYASFKSIASLAMDKCMPNQSQALVTATFNRAGLVGQVTYLPAAVYNVYYDATLGHNVPDVFWAFMNQTGLVYNNGYCTEKLVDWLYGYGLPITDAYWTRAVVAGQEKDVLVQLFERRVLTYTPSNPPGWQVEMGNIGRHYLAWRYGGIQNPAEEARVTIPLHILAYVGQPNDTVTVVLHWQNGTELKRTYTLLHNSDGRGLLIANLDWGPIPQTPVLPTQKATLTIRNSTGIVLALRHVTVLTETDPNVQAIILYWVENATTQGLVTHIPRTTAIGTAALQELLWGPPFPTRIGYATALPTPQQVLSFPGRHADWGPRVTLRSLTIVNGVATADFSQEMAAYGGGSLRVQLIRQQITRTLLQFASVHEVRIAIEGKTEAVLEP